MSVIPVQPSTLTQLVWYTTLVYT